MLRIEFPKEPEAVSGFLHKITAPPKPGRWGTSVNPTKAYSINAFLQL